MDFDVMPRTESQHAGESTPGVGARMLSAADIMALGFSRIAAYQLLNRQDFPTVRIGRRLYVRYDRFIEWMDSHANERAAV